jgi:molybdenum cofactor biosynthesis enzyme MoaA
MWRHRTIQQPRCKKCRHWRAVADGLCWQCLDRDRKEAMDAIRVAMRVKRREAA